MIRKRTGDIFKAWGRILTGYRPVLSVEITKSCPLSCPGCYAFQPEHVGGTPLVSLSDFDGDRLVRGVLDLVSRHRPLAIYLVGGEPLVRFRELNELLPELYRKGLAVHVVTSAVRPIPREWASLEGLDVIVSVDGLPPDHDARRSPATYERILKHITGHRIIVHCTITSQIARQDGYLEEFLRFWSARTEVRSIEMSLFTPQVGETSVEILDPDLRRQTVAELGSLHARFPKLRVNAEILEAFVRPPSNPDERTFARITRTVSADLKTEVTPCQFGGTPDCSQCGCLASMALHALSNHRLTPGIRLGTLFEASSRIGAAVQSVR